MAYAILRVAKMKSMGNVGGQSSHVERLRETPNADPTKIELNQRLAGTDSPVHDVQERLGEAGIVPRKGAVVAIDVFITASPEHFGRNHPDDPKWKAFQEKAMQFLAKEYGGRNVVHAIAHHDETSPHLHAIVVPIKTKTIRVGRKVKTERKEERLCCRDWLGGDRKTLSKLQTRFADHVKELGLSRGVEGSQAKHNRVSQFYTVMNETVEQAQAIYQALPTIEADYYVRAVAKPNLLERAQPYKFAQAQVVEALSALRQQIEQTNTNAWIARQGELVKLQNPVQSALQQKSQSRESQAEAALRSLGYRLDQHGQLVNIQEERKQALRATISSVVQKHTTIEELRPALQKKGVRLGFYDDPGGAKERQDGKSYRPAAYEDGKGERIWGRDLGPDYTTLGLLGQLEQVRLARERQEREKEYARQYDAVLAQALKERKGDCRQTADYLKSLSEPARAKFYQDIAQELGVEAAGYFRQRLETDRQKTPLQLSADREHLRSQGLDVGQRRQQDQSQSKGQSMGGR